MTKKILVVEDDRKIAMALCVQLKAAGYHVVTAADGVTGVMVARKESPDLLLMDISMPAGGGFSVAERVQNLAGTAGTPMIFMTASKEPGLKERAEELGAKCFLEKPYDFDVLLTEIKAAIGSD